MKKSEQQSFGTLLGYAPGSVAVYSSDYESAADEDYPKIISLEGYTHPNRYNRP
ncbi:hypothetical protein [Psychromonas antarctica]|uniref:hypothetical protein n=1 Tax=Psychromonas antarctica TaxID=67573 RepID=UPI001EE7D2A9|nr:hypothetical protein [Psychromonas antarctica]MCG6202145.1 hypothetical protein [Psychromonas antarctica]